MQEHSETPIPRAATGIEGLDLVLHGGLVDGRIYLLEGNPGAGKTTLALQYLLEGVRHGERCLYITLSETRHELIDNARSHGWSLDGIEILELLADNMQVDGEGELTMYHPSEVELGATTRRALAKVEELKPRRVVLDSLSELRLLAQSSLRYRRQILGIKQFLGAYSCSVLLLDDRTGEGSDMQLQSIAHGVISLDSQTPAYGRTLRQLRVVKFRGSDFRSGVHDFIIGKGGITVFPRLSAAEHGASFTREKVPSGVPSLDALMGGGIDRGTTTLLVGPPGSGKSTIALQYAHAATLRGDHAAIFSFEEAQAILFDRARGLGMPVNEGPGPGQIAVRQIDPAEISPGEFAQRVRHAVESDQARVVVIDSLNGYLNALPEDKFLTAQLHELLAYLNNHGVVTFLVAAQSGMLGPAMRSPIDASYLADSVVVLRMYEHDGSVRKAISVVKKRSGRHEDSIRRMWFDSDGVHLSEPLMHLRGVLTGVPTELQPGSGDKPVPRGLDAL
ncbi:ATPase domain-containing protein [Piscinibacter gummiphilus]|uniref:non-specific serine/threonine protein kinase n=1 Tax=Piscinibacter gummiphilus TaxID=946333 RepID=A0ABZ0CS24_9BURK|nr:ATPase domain-containing protein [Piscinibacter gummiphilus]WOB07789.1 ATPase domain-containing protein [Piscinibacter gummiphilus]